MIRRQLRMTARFRCMAAFSDAWRIVCHTQRDRAVDAIMATSWRSVVSTVELATERAGRQTISESEDGE